MEAVAGQRLGERVGVGAVVLLAPEAAVHERHGDAAGPAGGGLPDVVDVGLQGAGDLGAVGGPGAAGHDVGVVVAHLRHGSRPARGGARVAAMTKYEYATVPLIVHATKQILDQWGEDGWELVQVLVMPEGNLVAYLKRPKA